MGMSNSNSGSYVTSEQAKNLASYQESMMSVYRLNTSAEENIYNAQILRNNASIYQNKQTLQEAEINIDLAGNIELIGAQKAALTSKTAIEGLTSIASARARVESEIGQQKMRELQGGIDLANKGIQLKQGLINSLDEARKNMSTVVGKVVYNFNNRGFVSPNMTAIINSELQDRNYSAQKAMTFTSQLFDMSELAYNTTTALQRANMATDIGNVMDVLGLEIQGQQNSLQSQLNIYDIQSKNLTAQANNKKQQLYYDTQVKIYNDVTQANLYDYRASSDKALAQQSILTAGLKLAASDKNTSYVRIGD